jgi:HSP20 family protein
MSAQTSAPAKNERDSALAPVREQRPRRWEPVTVLEEMQADLMRLMEQSPFGIFPFGRSLRRIAPLPTASMPRVDVFEQDGKLVVKAELPGVKKEDIDLEIQDGDLVLRAERKEEREVKDENWYRMERSYGSLYRRLPLPEGVQPDQMKATLNDGVLEVAIPKPVGQTTSGQKIPIS